MNRNKGLLIRTWALLSFLSLLFISASIQAATVRYQHTDMLGSVVAESDASGNIISRSQYEPFGKRLGGDKEGIGYTGHLQDKDLGLTYMQARYYDPLIGRFYANDPMGFKNVHNFNRYAYGNNNPYRYTDPDGKAAESYLNRPQGMTVVQHQTAMVKAGGMAGGAIARGPLGAAVQIAVIVAQAASDLPSGVPNDNPYDGPVDSPVIVVDGDGNAIPVDEGEQITASPNGDFQQVRDKEGKPTGVRMDKGGHKGQSDPKAQAPHGHRPGVTDENGNPHLPLKPPKDS